MTTTVIINGAKGKMGSLAVSALQAHNDFTVVAQLGRHDNLGQAIEQNHAEIVIDLTTPDAVYKNTQTIIKHRARPVIGTTGLTIEQMTELQSLCEDYKLGGIVAPNFSLSAVLMMKYAADAARYFADAEIIEMHHPQKIDAPSGTALKTAQMMAMSRQTAPENNDSSSRPQPTARGDHHCNTAIHAVRLPGLIAHQEVIFGGVGEVLTIRSDAMSRQCFMRGLIIACLHVTKINQLVYGLENIL